MAKKKKLETPEWIIKGFDSPEEYEKSKGLKNKKKSEKIFNVRRCPKCNSDEVNVKIGELGIWECKKCKWEGKDVNKEELNEEEFMKYLDNKEEEVA
jgi:ribosomal protein L37AE/L43A